MNQTLSPEFPRPGASSDLGEDGQTPAPPLHWDCPPPCVSSHSPVPPAETPLLAPSTRPGVAVRCLTSGSHGPQMWCPDLEFIGAHASTELREEPHHCRRRPYPRPALSASATVWVSSSPLHGSASSRNAANARKAPISSGKCHRLEGEAVLLSILCLMRPFASEPHNYFHCMEGKERRW